MKKQNNQITITYKVSPNIVPLMVKHYRDLKREKTPPYALFQAYDCGTVITLYESGKVVFQGLTADIDADIWIEKEYVINKRDVKNELKKTNNSKKENKEMNKSFYFYNAIGSDEVGTGDYFGPIIVTATFASKESRDFLEELHIADSKEMKDEKIISVAPIIMKKIPYVTFTLSTKKFNELTAKGFNMNKIKAILHNKVLNELSNKINVYDKIIVDQFVSPSCYFNYLAEEKINPIVKDITFLTKGENKNLSVAAASVISRYIFLNEMDNLSNKYGQLIPRGASDIVDNAGKQLVKTFGKDVLEDVAKINFKNTERILKK